MTRLIKSQLHLNGWVAVLIGSFIILDPVSMLTSYGLQSDLSAGLLSELRAPGGLLFVAGLAIVYCALQPARIQNGLLLSVMVFGGYGGVRLLAMVLDGLPPVAIQLATAVEISLCVLSLVSLNSNHLVKQPAYAG